MADLVAAEVEREADIARPERESATPGGASSSAGLASLPPGEPSMVRPAAGVTGQGLRRPERSSARRGGASGGSGNGFSGSGSGFSGSGGGGASNTVGGAPAAAVQHCLRRSPAGPTAPSHSTATPTEAIRRPDPVLRRSPAEPGVIRRFYAVVDDPEPGKTYGKVQGVPYEWRAEERDKTIWEESTIETGWWMRRLYQRKKAVEPGNGENNGAGKSADKKPDDKLPGLTAEDTLPTSGGTPNANPGGKKPKGRRGSAKGLNAEDKGVVMHLAEVLEADKPEGEGPDSKAKAERVKDLVSQAKQVESNPELAAETTATLDEAALANASSRPGGSKGGPSGSGAKGTKDVKDVKDVKGAKGKDTKATGSPSADAKPFSVPSEQQAKLSLEWGLSTDDPKFVYAMTSQATLDFFSRLTPDQRTYLSKTKMKKLEAPTESDIAAVKKEIEEKVRLAAEAQKKKEDAERAKQAKAELDKKHTENKAQWAKRRLELRDEVRKRVETEMPDYRWEKAFDAIVGVTDDIINQNATANLGTQIKTAEKKVTAELDKEKKIREVAAIEKKYPSLYTPVMRDLKEKVLADTAMSVVTFEQQVQAAITAQRNPTKVDTWAKLLKLSLYKVGRVTPFERLTSREGLDVHYSVDLDGLRLPAVADDTTPDELIDAVLFVGKRYQRLHVTLETGVEAGADKLKLPHRYWARDGQPADYDLYIGGPGGRPRWKEPGPDNKPPGHTEDQIKKGLDDAYTEIRDRLKARAKLVLDNDCNPRYFE